VVVLAVMAAVLAGGVWIGRAPLARLRALAWSDAATRHRRDAFDMIGVTRLECILPMD
jgi:hypothetical protein